MMAMFKKSLLTIAASLACLLPLSAGHFLDDHSPNNNYVGQLTIGFNVPSVLGFNATYDIYDVQLNYAPGGTTLRILNLDKTVDSSGTVNDALQIEIAASNNLGAWLSNGISVFNIQNSPGMPGNTPTGSGTGNGNRFFVQTWQPNCSWQADVMNTFGVLVPDSTYCNTIVFFDWFGFPVAAFDPTGWQLPMPSATPTHAFGHFVDYSASCPPVNGLPSPWLYGSHTIADILSALGPGTTYDIYKF